MTENPPMYVLSDKAFSNKLLYWYLYIFLVHEQQCFNNLTTIRSTGNLAAFVPV